MSGGRPARKGAIRASSALAEACTTSSSETTMTLSIVFY
jgi:hypothetical protein